MTTRLLLVRHGQTAYNAEIRFMGQLDIPLDDTGRVQVQAVARRLRLEKPASLYSSGLSRAVETANAIRSALASPPELQIEPRLTEGHFGEWQGRTYESLKIEEPETIARWKADRLGFSPPGSEALSDLANRVQAAYERILDENRDQTAIVVAHGGSLQVMLALALGLPLEHYWQLWMSNASVSELRIDERGTILQLLNDISHLQPTS